MSLTFVIPARSSVPTTLIPFWYAKHPADNTEYLIDATGYLNYNGRTVVGIAAVSVNSTDITITNVAQAGPITSFFASGGQDVTSYFVTWSVTLDDGSTLTRDIKLSVLSLFPASLDGMLIAKGDKGDPGSPGLGLSATISLAGLLSITDANGFIWTIQLAQPVSQSGGNADFTSDFTPDFS